MAVEYDPIKTLQEEVDRFKRTNQFNPLLVTHFYCQAAVVLDRNRELNEELHWKEQVIISLNETIDRLRDNYDDLARENALLIKRLNEYED